MNVSKKIDGLTESELSILSGIFRRFKKIETVTLFGSRAMGNYKPGSDVDLALKGSVDANTLFHVREALEESSLPYFFDLVVYKGIETAALKEHIDTCGTEIYGG